MLSWLQKGKKSVTRYLHHLQINDEYFEPEPPLQPIVSMAMIQVLQIHLITDKIFGHLTLRDLKSCRLVHPAWTLPVSNFMVHHDMSVVTMDFNYATKTYQSLRRQHFDEGLQGNGKKRKKKQINYGLQCMNTILEKSSNFPCTNFEFSGGHLTHPDVCKFFKTYGPRLETLRLSKVQLHPSDNESSKNSPIIRIKKGQNQSTKSSSLYRNEIEKDGANNNDLPSSLSSLKNFSWTDSLEAAGLILKISENLTKISHFDFPADLSLLLKAGKIDLIQNLTIDPTTCDPSDLSNFIKGGPQLKRLACMITDSYFFLGGQTDLEPIEEWTRELNKFLKTCQPTLTSLTWQADLWLLAGLEPFPSFRKLSHLKLEPLVAMGQDTPAASLLPTTIMDLAATFPNVVTLDLCHTHSGLVDLNSYFPMGRIVGSFPSVKNLKICPIQQEKWMQDLLHQICPKFKNLTVLFKGHQEFDEVGHFLPIIFRLWSHLEKIDLIVNMPKDWPVGMGCDLDGAFTGMSQQSCERLRQQFTTKAERGHLRNLMRAGYKFPEKLDNLKIRPGLCDLQDLKTLNIYFNANPWRKVGKLNNKFPITWLTGFFTFDLILKSNAAINLIYHNDPVHLEDLRSYHADVLQYLNLYCEYRSGRIQWPT